MPQRVQLKRTRGWKKPPECVVVSRPSPFGNPFTIAGYLDVWNSKATIEEARRGCVGMYRDWIAGRLHTNEEKRMQLLARVPELRGKDLGCWCPAGSPCHADVLLELANRE